MRNVKGKRSINAYVWPILDVWACARPIIGSGVEIQRSSSVCFDASMIDDCQNFFRR